MEPKSYIRMFGVTETGHSVLAVIEDFAPYFYVPAPRGFRTEDINAFANYLTVSFVALFFLRSRLLRDYVQGKFDSSTIDHVEIVKKMSLQNYYGDTQSPFIKIIVKTPKNVPRVRDKCI